MKTKTQSLFVQAVDTLFFRNASPFSKGEDTWATGAFPPTPTPFYGALRSLYFSHHIQELPSAQTPNDPTKHLEILFFCLAQYQQHQIQPLLPLPQDLVGTQSKNTSTLTYLQLIQKNHTLLSSNPLPYLLTTPDNQIYKNKNGLLPLTEFQNYLQGQKPSTYIPIENTYEKEEKIGIARNPSTLTAQEHMLYRVGMVRPKKNFGFLLQIANLPLPKLSPILKLGGENKCAYLQTTSSPQLPPPPHFHQEETFFKIVLTTPAIFQNGWLPSWIQPNTLQGQYNQLQLKLIAAATGPPLPIGGFHIKYKLPKILYQAVSAGSVYYFQILRGNIQQAIQFFHNKKISDHLTQEGYGLAFLAKIPNPPST